MPQPCKFSRNEVSIVSRQALKNIDFIVKSNNKILFCIILYDALPIFACF